MPMDMFPYKQDMQLKCRNNNPPKKQPVILLLLSTPTHFQCLTNIDFFHPNAALPIRNIPNAAYNNTTTKTKTNPTDGRALLE